jgi:hypothetical protein
MGQAQMNRVFARHKVALLCILLTMLKPADQNRFFMQRGLNGDNRTISGPERNEGSG